VVFVVAACAGVGGWLIWQGRRRSGAGVAAAGRKLAVAETRSLGSRQYLVVATYGEKKFLLGVCPGRINLLTSLEDDRPKTP
jgi:flagellar protein FliO/FliZ